MTTERVSRELAEALYQMADRGDRMPLSAIDGPSHWELAVTEAAIVADEAADAAEFGLPWADDLLREAFSLAREALG